MKKTNNKGFSLVELIIVIAIMAVLIGVMAPQFMKYVERSRKSTDVQNVGEVCRVIQTYVMDPMITNNLSAGSHTLAISTGGNNATGVLASALADGGMTGLKLKSNKWHSGTVTINIKVDTNGNVTFADSAGTASEDIIKGVYN